MISVSVCLLCYNHEKYVSETIESVLAQKVNFKYEILIYDDASSDGSQMIIRKYEQKYPDIIKPFYQDVNQYSLGNTRLLYEYCYKRAKGKYIAICECDDFWTDVNKLQYQFNFMEKNSMYSIHMHAAKIINDDSSDTGKFLGTLGIKKDITLDNDMRNFYPTASKFFKKSIFDNVPEYYFIGEAGDFPAMLLTLSNGNGFYEGKVMSAYRVGVPGSANARFKNSEYEKKERYIKERVKLLREYNNYSKSKHQNSVNRAIIHEHNQLIHYLKNPFEKLNVFIKQRKMNEYRDISKVQSLKLFISDFLPFYKKIVILKNRLVNYINKGKQR